MSDDENSDSNITIHIHPKGPTEMNARIVLRRCPRCGGEGELGKHFGEVRKCPRCGGGGSIPVAVREPRNPLVDTGQLRHAIELNEAETDE